MINNLVLQKFEEKARIEGADKALNLLRILESVGKALDSDTTLERYFADDEFIYKKIFELSGDVSPRLAGFMGCMVEYIYRSHQGGVPNLNVWRPEAGATRLEIARMRQVIIQDWLEDEGAV